MRGDVRRSTCRLLSRRESYAQIDHLPMAIGLSPSVIAKPPDWPRVVRINGLLVFAAPDRLVAAR